MNRVAYTDARNDPGSLVVAPRRILSLYGSSIALEDLGKTNTWLEVNSIISRGRPVCFVEAAQYFKVNSEKARRLAWISESSRNVSIVDYTPFCRSIENLYMTWRYIDRSILGYQHYYAFAGGHAERVGDRIVSSLDYDLNVSKIAPHCVVEKNPIRHLREVVRFSSTQKEHNSYKKLRDKLFQTKKTPQPIVTGLADLVNSFDSRRKSVMRFPDNSVVITNLAGYAKWYQYHGFASGTYSKPPDVSGATCVIFAESPIVYSHRRLRIEMECPEWCKIVDIVGDTKCDKYLFGEMKSEIDNVNRFCTKLIDKQNESLSKPECP